MNPMGCEHENRTIRAWRSGEWTSALREHLAGCVDCGEALRVAQVLNIEAKHSELLCHPPDAHWILERSRRLAREAAVRRMSRLLKAINVEVSVLVVM